MIKDIKKGIMKKIKYCLLCQRNVQLSKNFNWGIFLASWLLFGVGGIIYIIWYVIKPATVCPLCGTNKLIDLKENNEKN